MARLGNNRPLTVGGAGSNGGTTARKPRKGTVTLPYDPIGFNAPPAGTFNPQIQQEVERSRRGINDLLEELELEAHRSKQSTAQKRREIGLGRRQSVSDTRRDLGYERADLNYNLGQLGSNHSYRLQQLGINFGRAVTDLSTAKIRGQEDYTRTLTNMQHEYGSRAEQQAQAAIQQGTDETGTATASAAVRGANQAFDKSNVDLSHNRSEQDYATQGGRLQEDYGRNVARENETYGSDVGRQNEGFDRQQLAAQININRAGQGATRQQRALSVAAAQASQDRATKASHAEREQGIYETNAAEDAYYEAHQLHPNVRFPGGSKPGVATQGPHALYPAAVAAAPKGINVGGSRRLTAPRY